MLHIFAMGADAAHWQIAFFVLRPIETMLFFVHVLYFLKIIQHAFDIAGGFVWRSSIDLFASCSVVGFAGNLVAAILRSQLFQLSSDGLAAVAMNDTVTSARILLQFSNNAAGLSFSSSIQPLTEAFMLAVLGVLTVVVMNKIAAYVDVNAFREIKRWRTAALLIFVLPCATFAAFEATIDAFQDNDYACLGACSVSCTNNFSLMRSWLDFTPEYRSFVAFSSSPLLWCLFWFLIYMISVFYDHRRNSATYLPSDDHHSQLLGPESLIPQGSRNFSGRAARSITTAELDSSSCSYFHSKAPSAGANDLARCRSRRQTLIFAARFSNSVSICLAPLTEGEKVRLLPCMHYYLSDCVDPWVMQKNHCPVCRCPLQCFALIHPKVVILTRLIRAKTPDTTLSPVRRRWLNHSHR
jgi:hypothetical protein